MAVGDFGDEQGQRTEAIAALEKASAVGAEGGGSAKKAGQRGRQKDAWGDKLEPPNWIKGAIGNGPYHQLTL